MPSAFAGKTALISGASQGIGLAIAERFAHDGAALALAAHPSDAPELERICARFRSGGVSALAIASDQAEHDSGRLSVDACLDEYGRIDITIANAGVSIVTEFEDSTDEQWCEIVNVNLTGTYRLASSAARAMIDGGGGAIGMTASTCAWLGEEQMVAYNVSKAGVVSLARSMGVALARHSIRVNAVAPGWVATPLAKPKMNTPWWNVSKSKIPMRRAAEAHEVAAAFAWLCSEEASYITGQTLVIDGGQTSGLSFPREDMDRFGVEQVTDESHDKAVEQ